MKINIGYKPAQNLETRTNSTNIAQGLPLMTSDIEDLV